MQAVTSSKGETSDRYFTRYAAHRSAIGKVRRIRDLESSWNVWVSPKLGTKPIALVTREDVEDVRDAQVAQRKTKGSPHGLSGARARNVWSVLTAMMKEACTSKLRELRVRADNPCSTVQAPDKTGARAKTFIYPTEFLTLAACVEIPRDWRELYAIACYLYLRPGELRALTWSDVDFEAGVVHVTKAYDEDADEVTAPKTAKGVRDVPMPLNLVPLLEQMKARTKDASAAVAPLMAEVHERRRAGWLRKHFKLAKIDRSRLTEQSATTMQINFRSWRDTGLTWLALDGVDLAKIQRRAGHERVETTLGYVKMAEDLTGSIGEPFPPLPASLVAPTKPPTGGGRSGRRGQARAKLAKPPRNAVKSAERAGFESARSAEFTANRDDSGTTGPVRVDLSTRSQDRTGPDGPDRFDDPIESLTRAIVLASEAGQWSVVQALVRQVERIELARAGNVVALDTMRNTRG